MNCASCGAENREGRKFCGKCAAPLARKCPKCGASNEPDESFCGECGAALASSPAAPARKPAEPQIRVAEAVSENLEGERKTVTALFADIKGSMELIEDLDPEEARARPGDQADDRRGASLRRLHRAIHRRWSFRIVRRTGRA
jgi:hypothetical protein